MEALPLPVVDVGSLRNATGCVDSAGLRTKLAHRIRSALETYGFFYLVGHEVDLSAVDQKVGEFLRRSETDPVKVNAQGKPGGGVSGYYPLESMNTWKIFGREGRPDCHEQFTWKQPVTPEERQQSAYLSSDLGYATNPDNPELPGAMISVLEKGFEEMEAVALLVLSLICKLTPLILKFGQQPNLLNPTVPRYRIYTTLIHPPYKAGMKGAYEWHHTVILMS